MSPEAPKVKVTVDGRQLMLSNLDKVLYPEAGFTKAEVIDYYQRIAPVLLPHIRNRPVTIKRYPEGVDHDFFYQKNAPAHRPEWVPTARLPSPGSTKSRQTIEYLLGGDLPTLIWAANLAALELHTPMWRLPDAGKPDLLVFDLDPGQPGHCRAVLQGSSPAAAAPDRPRSGARAEDLRRQGPAAVRGRHGHDVRADQRPGEGTGRAA